MTTLSEEFSDEIGVWLLDLRENERMEADPQALPPVATIEDANAVLNATCKVTSTLGEHVGWKCGACTESAWTKLGLTEPFRAPLHRLRIFQQSSSQTPVAIPSVLQQGMLAIEAEFAFIMSKSLPPQTTPYTDAELWDAVEAVVPALEVCGTRWTGPAWEQATGFQKITDFGLNQNVVLGSDGTLGSYCQTHTLNDVRIQILVNGTQIATGSGCNVLGHPIKALGWLASDLNRCQLSTRTHMYGGGQDIGLVKGDVVMSGATVVVPANAFQPGDVVTAVFEGMGEVSLVLAVKSKM